VAYALERAVFKKIWECADYKTWWVLIILIVSQNILDCEWFSS